jgi:GNAT superfamily N-acetyltransferase
MDQPSTLSPSTEAMWRFRLAQRADVPALAALYVDAALKAGPQAYTCEQIRAWTSFGEDLSRFSDYVLGARTWLAEADDVEGPAGFCGIDDSGEVRSLYVRAGLGRRGLGSLLLGQALADAQARGLHPLTTWATPFSCPLFERHGFKLLSIVRQPFQGVMFERRRMQK